jgi:branched-chain amino acid aminotransferase
MGPDGTPLLFRPDLNAARMNRSAARLALPQMDESQIVSLIKKFVAVEKRWIPFLPGYSLYIRPTLIGTRPHIGLTSSDSATFYIIVNTAGSFFKQDTTSPKAGVKPIALFASYDHVRAWPGGTGAYKVGGNYAPCFMPQEAAAKQGYQQILWLLEDADPVTEQDDGVNDMIAANGAVEIKKKSKEMRITEAGQMNFFAVLRRPDGGAYISLTVYKKEDSE